eukprot:1219838-Pleurochrysis_carterae.AAC.1
MVIQEQLNLTRLYFKRNITKLVIIYKDNSEDTVSNRNSHVASRRVTSRHVASRRVETVASRRVALRRVTSHHVPSLHVTPDQRRRNYASSGEIIYRI